MINININDDNSAKLAQQLGHHQNLQETIEKALEIYLQSLQKEIIQEFGKIDFHEDYDYKKQRGRQ
ncbi:MAG: type II toxin-antitoxin system VapB family antitoxin [Methylococcaceae bacterium]|nr:type II toxin-antitoxin system VapB family antitoxin [Methylococcaceae bacterium]